MRPEQGGEVREGTEEGEKLQGLAELGIAGGVFFGEAGDEVFLFCRGTILVSFLGRERRNTFGAGCWEVTEARAESARKDLGREGA